MTQAMIDLWWLPLGAGGHFVRMNGRIHEAIQAYGERRKPLDLYHTALEVRVPEGRFVIENAWPIPDTDGSFRGVVAEGPVFDRRMTRLRALRYEVRRWRDGVISDAAWAVASPQHLSDDTGDARQLLDLVPSVPVLVWGRDEAGADEMWNSNSVISWLLARSGCRLRRSIRLQAGARPVGTPASSWRAESRAPASDGLVHDLVSVVSRPTWTDVRFPGGRDLARPYLQASCSGASNMELLTLCKRDIIFTV